MAILTRISKIAIVTMFACAGAAATADEHRPGARTSGPQHGISKYGALKYPPGFRHFDYVNPEAPKGGRIRLAATGTFDKINPYNLKGVAAAGATLLFDTLMEAAADEPQSLYGLVAETVEVAADRAWARFNIRPQARFNDGTPITAEDIVFTFETLKTGGHPRYRLYLKSVSKATAEGSRRVRFDFAAASNRELPLLVAQLPILSKKDWQGKDFSKANLTPPLGSGPYRIQALKPGRNIVYRRVANYWASDLPVKRGRHNFDVIQYDYYRDRTVALEAFKAGEYDLRQEYVSKFWATAYDTPAVEDRMILKRHFSHRRPAGMQAFVFNTRRPIFSDRRVRKALAYALDFEWTNAALFYGLYHRTRSYFSNSVYAAEKPPTAAELAILSKYRGQVPEEVFSAVYRPPRTSKDTGIRNNLIAAQRLLQSAGWVVRNGTLFNEKTGAPFQFEILLNNPSFERIAGPFVRNLGRLGIKARIRVVDTSQYQNRRKSFSFDMTLVVWRQSLSPGNEQRNLWTSSSADVPGSLNFAGVRDPVVDALVEEVVSAPTRDALIAATRSLDRVLLWGHYVIPNWHSRNDRVALWDRFGWPRVIPARGYQLDTWWEIREKADRVDDYRGVARQGEAALGFPWRSILILAAMVSVFVAWGWMFRRRWKA
ncbi:MAG: extracellular solute-binding protein [Alphaproteobacteria bacterium]|nr:extracellular solute-binding protein [Alphaproteobacteria bacterium]